MYSGASLGEEFDGELARAGALKARMPYQTNKDLRNSINAGMISYHDVPLGQMPVWVKNNFLKHIDVAIIEAAATLSPPHRSEPRISTPNTRIRSSLR